MLTGFLAPLVCTCQLDCNVVAYVCEVGMGYSTSSQTLISQMQCFRTLRQLLEKSTQKMHIAGEGGDLNFVWDEKCTESSFLLFVNQLPLQFNSVLFLLLVIPVPM